MCGERLNVISQTPASIPVPLPPLPTPTPTPPTPSQPVISKPLPDRIVAPVNNPSLSPELTRYQPPAPYVPPEPVRAPVNSPKTPLLRLIHSSGREFYLSGESGYIGRQSQSMPVPPEIDLTGIAHEDIISRHHARISWDSANFTYTIVDMSTNGIVLNGDLLTAGVPYRLIDGDNLQLGQDNLVSLKVVIK
jgi:hypothetical protein